MRAAKIFGQIFYWWGGYGQWQPLSPPAPSLAPSTRQFGYSDRTVSTHAMSKDEITAMHAALRQSARNLREAGFDGIMLHGSHAGLIEQFLSPYFNNAPTNMAAASKTACASWSNRCRRRARGPAATWRSASASTATRCCPAAMAPTPRAQVVKGVCERGLVDYVDLDVGVEPQQFHHGMPPAFSRPQSYRPFVEAVRGAAGNVPVLSVLGGSPPWPMPKRRSPRESATWWVRRAS